jgi:hypothetical protein
MRSIAIVIAFCAAIPLAAQQPQQPPRPRPLSPEGIASAQVLGEWVKSERETFTMGGERYQGGRWIDILYGRPLLRGREAFTGRGAEYGKATYAGAPIWRAGANVSTRLRSEVPLIFGNTTVPAGEHTLFIDTKSDKEWTLVVSSWKALQNPKEKDPTALWGGYGYTPDKDIVRAAMKVDTSPSTVDQLTWSFVNVTEQGGTLQIAWAKTVASVPFTVGS